MTHPIELQKITSEFIDEEDRVRVTGISEDQETIVFWLTQRLLSRLIVQCVSWLDKASPEFSENKTISPQSRTDLQGFAQQTASQSLKREDAVIANVSSESFLVKEVDLKLNKEGVLLIFRDGNKLSAQLFLSIQHLRQWLIIVHNVWQKANWPMEIWPNWIAKSADKSLIASASVH